MMNEPIYAAIVVGFSGPTLQIWHGMRTNGDGKPQPTLIPPIKLDDRQSKMTLDQLREEFKDELARL